MKETKIEIYNNGIINKDQCQKILIPTYPRSRDELNYSLKKFEDIWKIEQWHSEPNVCVVDNPVACIPDEFNPPNIQDQIYKVHLNFEYFGTTETLFKS